MLLLLLLCTTVRPYKHVFSNIDSNIVVSWVEENAKELSDVLYVISIDSWKR